MHIPASVMRLAALQGRVVSREQCSAAAMTIAQQRALVASGRWRRLHPGVYLTHNGPVEPLSHIWAATLAAGKGAAAARRTVLWLEQPKRLFRLPVEIVVDHSETPVARKGIVIYRSRDLRLEDGPPPRQLIEDAVLDIVGDTARTAEVIHLICDVVGGRDTTPRLLLTALDRRSRQRHRRLLTMLLAEVTTGAHSPLEILDLRNDKAHGLPMGQRQVSSRVAGLTIWQDVVVVVPETGRTLVKELDGRLGHEGIGRFRDMRRDNGATLGGSPSLRYGWVDLCGRPCAVAAEKRMGPHETRLDRGSETVRPGL